VDRAVEGMDAVVHLGAVPDEAPFDEIAGPNLHGAFHVFDACRRLGARRIVFASSNHATGMYPVGEPLTENHPPRPDGLYGASKVWGEALGRMYVDRFGLEFVGLRIGTFDAKPPNRRALATWLSHDDAVRLVDAALTARDVGWTVVYGASNNTRRWWPLDDAARRIGFEPRDDAETYADEVTEGPEYERQGGPNTDPAHGGWA
jgi:uronate dehydrogenase